MNFNFTGGFLIITILILIFISSTTSHPLFDHPEFHTEIQQDTLTLNNGKKWKVDDVMMVYLKEMENEINLFKEKEEKDFETLAKSLRKHVNSAIMSCTMTGKGHDELHKWLVPYITYIQELGNKATDKEAAMKSIEDLERSLIIFHRYFE